MRICLPQLLPAFFDRQSHVQVFNQNSRRRPVLFAMLLLLTTALAPSSLTAQGHLCPTYGNQWPPNPSLGLAAPNGHRPEIEGDYLVIEYDAQNHITDWYDYDHLWQPRRSPNGIDRNGSFLPIVYSREKIAVHVCNLHFDDQLTVTNSPFAIPEGGADIRGATVSTPLTSLISTLDTLETTASTGTTVTQSGVGFASTGAVTISAVTGVVPGSITASSGTANYTDTTVTVSGTQLAQMLYAYVCNAQDLIHTAQALNPSAPGPERLKENWNCSAPARALPVITPGSILGVERLMKQVAIPNHLRPEDLADFPAFDDAVTATQNLVLEINTLANSLSSLGLGVRAVTLQANYSSIAGVLDFIRLGLNDANCKASAKAPPAPQPPEPPYTTDQIKGLDAAALAALSDKDIKALNATQIQAISAQVLDDLARLDHHKWELLSETRQPAPPTNSGDDQPPCSTFEATKYDAFERSFVTELTSLVNNGNGVQFSDPITDPANEGKSLVTKYQDYLSDAETVRTSMFEQLAGLKGQLADINDQSAKIFTELDDWYQHSSVEQTDLITPQNNNSLMRISIVVQRGYTPFVMASAAPSASSSSATASTSGGSATTSSSNSSSSPTTASTSTPAHSVKTVLVEVHRIANFNLVAGAMVIAVPSYTYAVGPTENAAAAYSTSTVGSTADVTTVTYTGSCGTRGSVQTPGGTTVGYNNGTPSSVTNGSPTYACLVQTQRASWQVAGMTGVAWFPWGRDYFPRKTGWTNYKKNYLPSVLLATSVTSLGSAFGGINWEPISGIDFFGGIGSASREGLPKGVTLNTLVPVGYTVTSTNNLHGAKTFGIAFDLSVFTAMFSKGAPANWQ